MTTYEKIRSRCNEVLPERLELKEGCEVKTNKWSFKYPDAILVGEVIGGNKREFCVACRRDRLFEDEIIEIFGTPVTLSDILRAYERGFSATVYDDEITLSYSRHRTAISIKLSKSIKDQSPETLEAIYKLIKKL